jgi:hypothetical protein
MLEPAPLTVTDVDKSHYFLHPGDPRNPGEVPWKGRLLSRLGVSGSTAMPFTPRVVSVATS